MQDAPIRVLLAKVGLDGHDRGIKVLARSLRDAGMEVIYTGLWQSAAGAAKAAVEEDVDVFGVSFHSAAHQTLVPLIVQEQARLGRTDIPLVIGGIIPPDDVAAMKAAGVAAVFEPESSLEFIAAEIRRLSAEARKRRCQAGCADAAIDRLTAAMQAGNRSALGRVLTWIENHSVPEPPPSRSRLPGGTFTPQVRSNPHPSPFPTREKEQEDPRGHRDVLAVDPTVDPADTSAAAPANTSPDAPAAWLAQLPAEPGPAMIVGVTGAPGVGKSTLIGRLLKELRSRGKQVAVLAVDPASPITGGALLGDRARMTIAADDPGVFVRSSANRGELGGVAPATGPMIHAISHAKIDVVIVETVGAGQNDVRIRQWARPLLLLLMPGAGDELQLEKAGITEVANVFVINKADLPGAERLEHQIRDVLGTERPVVRTVASKGKGIDALADVLLGSAVQPGRQ